MTIPWEILRLPIAEITLVGALCGLVGVLAVLRGRVFFAESVTHGAFPGAVLGVVFGAALGAAHSELSLFLYAGAFFFCLPLAGLMRLLTRVRGLSGQAAAGIVLTFGFALGYFFAKWFAPLPLQVDGFLTGSLLHVNSVDVLSAGLVLAVVIGILCVAGRAFIALSFDEDGFRASGAHVNLTEGLLLLLILVTTVVVIPAVGTILSIALVAAPAASVKPLVPSARALLWCAPLVGVALGLSGLALAVVLNLSTGGTIAVLSGVVYVVSGVLAKLRGRRG